MISQQGRQWPQCGSGPGVIKKISGIAPFVGEKNEKKSACFTVVDCASWSAGLSPPIVGAGCSGVGEAVPITTDWSHQHVIFSRPSKPEQAARVEQDIRYWQQLYRRQQAMTLQPDQVEP